MKQAKKQQIEKMTVVKDVKKIPYRVHPENKDLHTGSIIQVILDYRPLNDPAFSLTTSQMRERFKILDAVDARHKDSTVIELTESQVNLLIELSPKIPWKTGAVVDRFIIDFEDSLK